MGLERFRIRGSNGTIGFTLDLCGLQGPYGACQHWKAGRSRFVPPRVSFVDGLRYLLLLDFSYYDCIWEFPKKERPLKYTPITYYDPCYKGSQAGVPNFGNPHKIEEAICVPGKTALFLTRLKPRLHVWQGHLLR